MSYIVKIVSIALALSIQTKAYSNSLNVKGWVIPQIDPQKQTPPLWLGDEPFFGRLSCPGITRLNLKVGHNESVFFSSIEVKNKTWKFELKPGFFWWDETPVTTEDVNHFFNKNMKLFIEEKSRKKWSIPNFSTSFDKESIAIHWNDNPLFGPYVLNGVPLFKQKEGYPLPYMCSGLYSLKTLTTLKSNKKYESKRPNQIYFGEHDVEEKNTRLWNFSWARDFQAKKNHTFCSSSISLPWVSGILWKNLPKETKIALTQVLPRGAFLKDGAMGLGTLLSGPIPRWHPGYDEKILVRTHISTVPEHIKKTPLKLFSAYAKSGLMEKLVYDLYRTYGWTVEWTQDAQQAVGVFKSFYLPIPQIDYLAFAPQSWLDEDKNIGSILSDYSLSTSFENPDFKKLKEIHSKIFENEYMTIFFQHRACVDSATFKNYDEKDPDFFKKNL